MPLLTLQTDIWLVVSVPVLSEQMTEVQPRVSTEGKLLTMAFFFAIRRVPKAKQVVMTAGSPMVIEMVLVNKTRRRQTECSHDTTATKAVRSFSGGPAIVTLSGNSLCQANSR